MNICQNLNGMTKGECYKHLDKEKKKYCLFPAEQQRSGALLAYMIPGTV